MVFKIQWKPPFWLATQNYPLNDSGWQFRVNYTDVIAQAPLNISTDLSKTMHPIMCDLKVGSNNTDTDTRSLGVIDRNPYSISQNQIHHQQ